MLHPILPGLERIGLRDNQLSVESCELPIKI